MTQHSFYVFSGEFTTPELAEQYFLPHWEPEPGDEVSDEEYQKWEDRNPCWYFRDDINRSIDQDFVEICYELEGVTSQIKEQSDRDNVSSLIPPTHNSFFIMNNNAISNHIGIDTGHLLGERKILFVGEYVAL